MRILHSSDLHLGRQLFSFSLLEDQKHMLDWLIEIIQQEDIDAVILAGDIYNRPQPAAEAVDLYNDFLAKVVGELGIPVFAIAGNHDGASWLGFGSALYQSSGYYIEGHISFPLMPIAIGDSHIRVWLMPYLHPSELRYLTNDPEIRTFDQAYHKLIESTLPLLDKEHFNILVGHGFFSNLSATGETLAIITSDSENNIGGIDITNANYFKDFDYVALGHLHAPQWALPEKAHYSGSPLKYSISEVKQRKSITILDVKGSSFTSNEMLVPPLRDVRLVSGSLDDLLLPSYHKIGGFSDYVFAEIIGTEQPYAMEKLRVIFPHILGLSFSENLVQTLPDIQKNLQEESRSIQEVFAQFYKEMKEIPLPSTHWSIIDSVVLELEEDTL